jgi:hypothetical protein
VGIRASVSSAPSVSLKDRQFNEKTVALSSYLHPKILFVNRRLSF